MMNDGTSRIICGDTPKDELMGNEARAFYKLITEPENNREKYRELRENGALCEPHDAAHTRVGGNKI